MAEQADWAWERRVSAFEHANAALMDEVRLFDDEQLAAHNAYGDDPGGELSGEVEANGCIWPLQELDKYYERAREPERAESVRVLLISVTGEPDRVVCELTPPETLYLMSAEVSTPHHRRTRQGRLRARAPPGRGPYTAGRAATQAQATAGRPPHHHVL